MALALSAHGWEVEPGRRVPLVPFDLGTNRREFLLLTSDGRCAFRRYTKTKRVAWSPTHGSWATVEKDGMVKELHLKDFHCTGEEDWCKCHRYLKSQQTGMFRDDIDRRELRFLGVFWVQVRSTLMPTTFEDGDIIGLDWNWVESLDWTVI